MPKTIHKDITPDEIKAMAEEYQALLQKSGVPMKLEQTIADMERRAAEKCGIPVEDWRAKWAAPVAPVAPAAPAKAPKKPGRAAVTVIDHDYFYVDPKNLAITNNWVKLRQEGIVMNLLLTGPSGCGKTTLLQRVGRDLGLPVYKIDCASVTTPDKWVGHKELVAREGGGQETIYVKSMLLKALAGEDGYEPGIVILDELNRLPSYLVNIVFPILDGSESIWVPDLGIYSNVHKDTKIAATANIGVGYSGTHAMDIALMDRFGATMVATFPPTDEEIQVLVRRTGVDEARAKILVNIAQQQRASADNGDFSKYISTRALIDTGHWIMKGMKILDAAQTVFINKFSSDGRTESDQFKVELLVKGMAGNN